MLPATIRRVSTRLREVALPLLGILLLAINLRPAITAVGPVLLDLGEDLSLSSSELGLLGALPIATFGAVSAFVQILIQRFSVERVTLTAMVVLTGATVLRSWPGPDANLWVGTVLIGGAIAIGNVAVPVFVKRSFPHHTASVTAVYVAVLGVFAGLAAALSAPLANLSSWGWRLSLGVWAVLTVLAVVFWAGQSLRAAPISGGSSRPLGESRVNLWRSAVAWQLSVYMGVQSSVFYVSITWLPTVEQHLGYSAVASGWHMFALQIAGVGGNLLAPVLMQIGPDQRFAAVLPGAFFLASLAGLYFFPGAALLWISVLGLGTGSAFVVSLSLIASRASDVTVAGHLSAMAQGVGYVIAAGVLYIAGTVAGVNILGIIAVLVCAGVVVGMMGIATGRNRMVDSQPRNRP